MANKENLACAAEVASGKPAKKAWSDLTWEEQDAEYARRQRNLAAQRRRARARHGKAERDARNHTLIVIGAMVEEVIRDGDEVAAWTRIDPAAWRAYVSQYADAIRRRVARWEPAEPVTAGERVKTWEAAERERRTAEVTEAPQPAAGGGDTAEISQAAEQDVPDGVLFEPEDY